MREAVNQPQRWLRTYETQCAPAFLLLSCTAPTGWKLVHVFGFGLYSARMRDTVTSISPRCSRDDIPIPRLSSSSFRQARKMMSGRACDSKWRGLGDVPVVCKLENTNCCRSVGPVRTPQRPPVPPGGHRLPPTSFPSIVVAKRRWLRLT